MTLKSGELPTGANNTLFELKGCYTQKGDACSDSEINEMEIATEEAGNGVYFVIKTDRWAFDSTSELVEVINDFIKRFNPDK